MKDTSFLQLLAMVMAMSLVPGCDARDLSDVTGVRSSSTVVAALLK